MPITLFSQALLFFIGTLTIFSLTLIVPLFPFTGAPLPHRHPCAHLISPSLSATFDWSSPSALDLAFCIQHRQPKPSTCLFYTSDARLDARRYAQESGNITIYDVYDQYYFNPAHLPGSQWNKLNVTRMMWKITSKAYAMRCSGKVSLVLPWNVSDEAVCPNSIWVTDEYEVIREAQGTIELPVNRISWVPEDEVGGGKWVRRPLRKRSDAGDGQGGLPSDSRRRVKRGEIRSPEAVGADASQIAMAETMVDEPVVEMDDSSSSVNKLSDELTRGLWDDNGDDPWAVYQPDDVCGRP
ncbi:uncharacterized protein AB675_7584 [Cyphellophora attinorum]|uniref:Uncharacterized protein n=1 Tax=Cyphellophora attinorum TaxID=1664694 RepID=A0A0N1H9P4_9EURO|nr:uncharacterized protein AB675_7584 [Phialophora attinorum]KPI40434.1 hypothetical protein AB675_7584 [Phialophora attinorum]